MSNNETFIDEVTEEVRRDKLFALMRRYGWIAILLVVVLVGGAAWNEWRKARDAAAAQALGDALMAAVETEDASARVSALAGIDAPGDGRAVAALLRAAEVQAQEGPAAAAPLLQAMADDTGLPTLYRDLAALKLALAAAAADGVMELPARRALLERIATPGAPFRLLAEEQLALIALEEGDSDAAITRLQAILIDNEVTPGLQNRVSQLIVALGGEPDAS